MIQLTIVPSDNKIDFFFGITILFRIVYPGFSAIIVFIKSGTS